MARPDTTPWVWELLKDLAETRRRIDELPRNELLALRLDLLTSANLCAQELDRREAFPAT